MLSSATEEGGRGGGVTVAARKGLNTLIFFRSSLIVCMIQEEQTYVIRVPTVSDAVLSEAAYCILYQNG